MKKILLILSLLRNTPKIIEEAFRMTQAENAELLVLFILDTEYADKIVNKLTNEGWIGGRPSEHFLESLLSEYELQAKSKIQEIKNRAHKLKIPVRSIIKKGSVLENALEVTQQEQPDIILIIRRKRSDLSRIIFGSLVKTLKQKATCDVKIIDED